MISFSMTSDRYCSLQKINKTPFQAVQGATLHNAAIGYAGIIAVKITTPINWY